MRYLLLHYVCHVYGHALPMPQRPDVNPTSEHSLYLRLFVTNSGGV
ncbi:MAG TPA: hypothetical protein VHC22_23350 [Pirellulales bacterium]|nr:hypothetical protein [Pirellulales bacterium]